ncbi:energy-coupling factor ABC transporter ATP-binding protein [Thalassospira marina]|uniref:Cobalt ABC transporter ATP-binding protein n=1 Tax=Thalassospira marina TaxID=2048283 RepID=A0A2N3KGG7_9PROT|nr:ATP-binding cassette domain-containing protein [Thalassospira marina]PKR49667.1 cobalt ABC transporter ATP-binding protein [Thalassospira marina]
MIELQNVALRYGAQSVLKDISLSLGERRIGIVGANGSGKSTLARLLNGLLMPTEGKVLVDGMDTANDGRKVRARVGFVFQNPDNQIVFPVVEEDLAFGLKPLKLSKEEVSSRIDTMLARYDLGAYRTHPSHQLSGGQKQLLAICGVLIMEPACIVFDEPTTLLDLRNRNRVAQAITALNQQVITVSHDLDLLADYDRILVIDQGQVVCDDIPQKALPFYVDLMS